MDVAAADLTLAQAFEVEDRILHYVEPDHPTHLKPFKGWVEVVNGNAYITATFNSVIQRGVEMVDVGGTVNVKSGSYTGNVDATASGVNKAISLAAGSSPGQVTMNGNLTLDANDTLAIEIEGTNAASEFDNFIVNGSITLGGSTLDLSGSYVPVNGDSFTILDGSTGLAGIFAGLNDGDEVTFNGRTLEIRYLAGPAFDVVLTAVEVPAITSAASTTLTAGQLGSFTVTTSGFPAPDLSASGALPSGVTFVDNGDGTATLAGTPAAGTGGIYSIVITASNGVGSNATQNFTLTVNEAPTITSGASATFAVAVSSSFTVTTDGFPTASISASGALPSGVIFVDQGDGTAVFVGTPAVGSEGTYSIVITASNGVSPNAVQNFTLTVTAPGAGQRVHLARSV